MQTGNKKSKAIKPDLTISMQDGTTYQLARIKKRHYMPMHPDQQETVQASGQSVELVPTPPSQVSGTKQKKLRRACATLCRACHLIEDATSAAIIILLLLLSRVMDLALLMLPGVPVILVGSAMVIPVSLKKLVATLCGPEEIRGEGWRIRRPTCIEAVIKMARKTSSGRNAAGAGSIRKKIVYRGGKKYEYWEGRITVGFDPGTGKQIQKSFTGKTQKEVLEKMQQAAAKIREMDYQEPSKMTVGEWLDVWMAEYLGNTKPHTKKSYAGIVDNHIKPAIEAVKLTSLTPIQVQKLINGIRSTKNTTAGQEVNPKTIKNVHGVLHSALAQAVRCGYLKSNPADLAVLPKRTKADIQVLDSAEITKFFNAIKGHRFEYLYQLDLFTGMRQSELLGLQWQDIDFDLKTITVRRQLQYLGHAHGGYQYTVLPDRAVEALLCQKEKQAQMAQVLGESWGNQDHLVFTDELGEHLKHDVVYRNLKRVFAGMGVPKLRFHDLRHSYAVLSLQSGCDIKTVQENLGHYAAAFTLDTYAHVTEQMRRDGAEKINRFLEKIDPKSPSGDQ